MSEHKEHKHGETCSCGHDHSHDHEHEHEHEHHHHEHGEACSCGHDHSHEHDHGTHAHAPAATTAKSTCTVYVMKNIDCANCSAKIEQRIKELPEVDDAILTFATRQLRVYSDAGTSILPKMQEIADKIEPGTKIVVREVGTKPQSAQEQGEHANDTKEILAGAVLFIIGQLLADPIPLASLACFLAAYIILVKYV